jgi:NifU-like protein involved in Fe-S cluster formation
MNFEKFKSITDARKNERSMMDHSVLSTFKNEVCGDDYILYLKIVSDVITDATFTTTGCGFGLAALSIATEWVKGKTLAEAEKITVSDIDAAIDGFPELRRHYPETAAEIMRKTIRKYRDATES